MLGWIDAGRVGRLTLVTSLFHRAHKRRLYETTLKEFRERRQRLCACHSHSKVTTLAFATGTRFTIHGSANLCGNGSGREQFEIVNDAGLHDWSAAWINELADRHEGKET